MPVNNKKIIQNTDDDVAVLQAIEAMPEPDRSIGEKLHAIITANALGLMPRTWYGMPAYSNGNKVICFFRSRQKFGERFMTIGFNDAAKLDEGSLWPICYALTELNESEENRLASLVKKAVS